MCQILPFPIARYRIDIEAAQNALDLATDYFQQACRYYRDNPHITDVEIVFWHAEERLRKTKDLYHHVKEMGNTYGFQTS